MKITNETIKEVPKKEQELLKALLQDVEEINKIAKNPIEIIYQDWHNEYSPERTDPCPDYYGYYRILTNNNETIGEEMTINDLDNALMIINETLNYLSAFN